jgi:hypothetical protein
MYWRALADRLGTDPGGHRQVRFDNDQRQQRDERSFAVAELAIFYGRDTTMGQVLRRMRCSGACGGRVGAAWLVTGPILNARVRPRRVPLPGPEARE